ncbi:hypothetical protein HOY82DRAFT_476357 [Tuber indicum]|nr:hypothetical protein HOY82DRAFT_476357 [Tuber indicum]
MTEWIPSLNKGFLFGGDFVQTLPEVTELEHNGLITYDQATNTWTNESTPLRGVSEGGLVHISTATDEILIQFGGKTEGSTSTVCHLINIYSTTKSKWYTQNLTSDAVVPAPRFSFCTALKSASDGSSHQIYITGGVEPHATDSLARTRYSVWVFSIPSFQWAELNVTQTAMAGVPTANISPKCLAIGKHYIFYYGGELDHDECDKKTNPAYLLDVNALKWTDDFAPDEGKYEIPPQVIELIGGDKNGGSTKRAPANGWSNPDLATIMALKTRSPGGPGPRPIKARPGSDPCKTNVRAIIGGTVAGVAAVVLGFLGWMMFLRRCQGSSSQLPHVNESVVYTAELPAGEIYTRNRGPVRPSTACTRTLGEGDNPAELMAHTQVTRSGIWVVELPSCEVAREMDTGI